MDNNMNENTNQSVEKNNKSEQVINNITEIPCASDEKIVISTVKEKKKTNFLPTIIIFVFLGLGLYYIDDIIALFDNKDNANLYTNNDDDNLVEGYIVIDDNTAFQTKDEIRFYNFNKSKAGDIIKLNYVSNKNYISTTDLSLYIELYNKEKKLIYKELFVVNKLNIDEVKTYNMYLDSNIYNDAKYAKVKKYTESDLNAKTLLTCRFKEVGQGFDLAYKNVYNFIGGELVSYDVNKEVNSTVDSTLSNKYKNDLSVENANVTSYGIKTIYNENSLKYTVDLKNVPEGFNIKYSKKDTADIVKNNDELKDWECE